MKPILLAVLSAALCAGCTINGGVPLTAWGKKDVSMLDYRTDAGQCTVLAVTATPDNNGGKSAGGIYGENAGIPDSPGASGSATSVAAAQTGGGTPLISGAMYRDSAPADFVNRAAMQQRTQEMSTQLARYEALRSCLSGRGYTEFELSRAQRTELARLPPGSDVRRIYLHKLGSDPVVLKRQSVSRQQPGS
jgi:hypothetical protein